MSETAHKRGAKVTGHLCAVNFREAADLGIDDLEHGLFVDTEFLPGRVSREAPGPRHNGKARREFGTAARHN